jgi:hypothetical protein
LYGAYTDFLQKKGGAMAHESDRIAVAKALLSGVDPRTLLLRMVSDSFPNRLRLRNIDSSEEAVEEEVRREAVRLFARVLGRTIRSRRELAHRLVRRGITETDLQAQALIDLLTGQTLQYRSQHAYVLEAFDPRDEPQHSWAWEETAFRKRRVYQLDRIKLH